MALFVSNTEMRAVNNLTRKRSLPVQVKARNTAPLHPTSILKITEVIPEEDSSLSKDAELTDGSLQYSN